MSETCCSNKTSSSSIKTPQAKINRQASRVLNILDRLSQSYKNYSSFLGMFDATLVDQRGPEGVTTHFKVVPGLCSRDGYLDLGVILALFDEVSSWAFIGTDRQLRPGVSVSLNAELIRWVREGEDVSIHCRAAKVGENLGFADMYLFDANGREVAHGRHVKFLLMGRAWNVAMQPWAFPMVYRVLSLLHPDLRRKQQTNAYIDSKSTRDHDDPGEEVRVGDLDLLFHLKNVTFHEGCGLATPPPIGLGQSQQQPLLMKATAFFTVIPSVCNTFGGMHGGAISTLAERFANLLYNQAAIWAFGIGEDRQKKDASSSFLFVARARSINVDYMSPCPKMAQLTLEAEALCIQPPLSSSSIPSTSSSGFPPLYGIHQNPPALLPTSFRVRFKDAKGRCLAQAHVMYPPPPLVDGWAAKL